jgi:tetraacyldisaccharide 4'-kinase
MSAPWRARLLLQWQRPLPTATCQLLRPLSWLYRGVVALRRAAFAAWPGATRRLTVPVVVVGNLIVGGAGKTPTVIALLRLLRAQGWTPGVVSRGYGRRSRAVHVLGAASTVADAGDEPLLTHRRGGVPVAVGADRVAAADALLTAHPEVDLVIADDGLQHLRLGRDVEVIVFDDRGSGNGLCLPAGPLREPMPPTPPPQAMVLYTAGRVSTPWPGDVGTRRLAGLLPLADWWRGQAADPALWTVLRGRPVVAAAGLARPQAFFTMLEAQGLAIRPLPLPDHHDFATLPWPDGADVVVTEKDAVKLDTVRTAGARIWVATLDFDMPPSFGEELRRRLPEPPHTAARAP